MRVKSFYRMLRIISAIVLFFFVWTFGPVWQVVAFAAEKKQPSAVSSQSSGKKQKADSRKLTADSSDRFEKTLEDIREKVGKAEEKESRNQDITAEVAEVKKKRIEVEALDTEFRKEFAATEKKLKDEKLPKEILDRHTKFVKHYEDNLKQLKAEIDDIEKATSKADKRATRQALIAAKAHLEKTKPVTRHQKLDPNKLPHRMVKGKEKAPRLKKEDFEREFGPRKKVSKLASLQADFATEGRVAVRSQEVKQNPSPVLLAYNDIASDIPFQLPRPSGERTEVRGGFDVPQSAFSSSPLQPFDASTNLLLAQATVTPPTADDLSETPEIQFTQSIKDLAAQLEYKPVKIYEWVRNNIEYVPTYGSIQGADQCLQSKICNDMDTASLLIALFRTSGIYAHYVYGTIEIPIEKAMNWVGGVTDPKMAGTILATNGVPAKMLVSGGTYKAVQLEHVYIKAWIDYIPSRGAVHRQGDTWIPLDPSYKQYTYTQGIDIKTAVPFDAQIFADQILSTATTNTIEGYVTNVNSAYIQQTMQDYQTQVQNYITQNNPNATVGDIIGKKEIIKQEYPYLMGTRPYKTVQIGAEFTEIPSNYRATMSFSIPDQTGMGTELAYFTSLPQIAGKKITLSFSPATDTDLKVIQSYLPKPHTDGSSIQSSELPSSFPAYLINLKPELRIDGQVVATGASATMGNALSFTISLNEPGIGVSNIDNIIQSGEYYGIGLDTGKIGNLDALKAKLESTKAKLDTQEYGGLTKDDLVGDFLSTVIATYFWEVDTLDDITAKTMNVIHYRAPSIGMFSQSLAIQTLFGIPKAAGSKGMIMDVDRLMQAVLSKDGNLNKVKQYMIMSGNNSSMLEHSVPELLFSMPENQYPVQAISAVKALKITNDLQIPLYTVNQANINAILPQLQVSADVKSDIVNAINAGKVVMVSKTNVTYNGWTGCGYIISDPTTGAGAYMISGGMNGAAVPEGEIGDCERTYWERVMNNFILTNEVIPGIFAPTGLGMLLGVPRAVAAINPLAGITFLQWARIGFAGAVIAGVTFTAIETGVLVAATALMSFILVSLAWEIGLLMGSLISAAIPTCQRRP